ncbi:lectin-like protein [Acetanaerobacterium elongatum]|uniref:Zinc-ribbon domain-containing protein n=1 Tax=Acetanaerobacterium elongatum TaxID=258515 RepID=A0A1G9UTE0_9FIRM|nr:lectin-like protein [Acetanaerobacterium elongatum]SDM63168.1 zinc-ribbon domain-containing protein [Acetanaerobacterium elongatum]
MFCPNCGIENNDSNAFCKKCGASLQETPADSSISDSITATAVQAPPAPPAVQAPQKKGGAGKFVAVIIILVVLAGFGVAGKWAYDNILHNPVKEFTAAIAAKDYGEALEIYDERIEDNEGYCKAAEAALITQLDSIEAAYTAGTTDYDSTIEQMNNIKKLGILNYSDVDTRISNISEIKYSKDRLANIQSLYDSGENLQVLQQAANVPENDACYLQIKSLKEQAAQAYKKAVMEQANSLQEKKEYEAGLNCINEALTVFPNDAELSTSYNSIVTEYKKSILTNIIELQNSNSYGTALELINKALTKFPNDSQLISLLDTVEAQKEQQEMVLKNEIDNQKNKKSNLFQLSPVDTDRYTGNEGDSFISKLGTRNGKRDVDGNTYEDGLEAWVARWNYKNEISWVWNAYSLDKQYSFLSGKVVIISDCYNTNNFKTLLQISGDNKVLQEYELTPDSLPIDISVNVSNIDRLVVSFKDIIAVSGGTSFGLVNMKLISNKPNGSFEQSVTKKQIPDDAVALNNHYYYLYNAKSWDVAKEFCESLGGHLATIQSQDENDFLFKYMQSKGYDSAYFGATDESNEGTWLWVTNEPMNYSNWHSGEPNSENSKEDYAMFYWKFNDGTWNDGDFGNSTVDGGNIYICEWE